MLRCVFVYFELKKRNCCLNLLKRAEVLLLIKIYCCTSNDVMLIIALEFHSSNFRYKVFVKSYIDAWDKFRTIYDGNILKIKSTSEFPSITHVLFLYFLLRFIAPWRQSKEQRRVVKANIRKKWLLDNGDDFCTMSIKNHFAYFKQYLI